MSRKRYTVELTADERDRLNPSSKIEFSYIATRGTGRGGRIRMTGLLPETAYAESGNLSIAYQVMANRSVGIFIAK